MIATAVPRPRRTYGMTKMQRHEAICCYIFIMPWLLGFLIFVAGPFFSSLLLSLTEYEVVAPPKFVGLDNYRHLFSDDPLFWQSLKVTVIYTFGSVPLRLTAALAVALMLNQRIWGVTSFRTIYYLPAVTSGVPVALLWQWIFNPNFGLLNNLLAKIGIHGPEWLFSPHWVLPAFIIMSLWGVGGAMVLYLAGLQGIPTQLYEAASIDGAGNWAKFRHITLPMITPVIFFDLIMSIIGSFQVFTQAYVMTQGGPMNASLFYVLYLYRNAFDYFKMGYASALAWVLFLIILGFTLLILKSSPMWVYYEGELRGGRRAG